MSMRDFAKLTLDLQHNFALSESTPAIELTDLTHRYPKAEAPALDGVNLTVDSGEIFGILGPNGGGKTTLFRILATLLNPSEGSARVHGHDTLTQAAAVRGQLGVVFQAPSLDDQLTAREMLACQGGLYGLSPRQSKQRGLAWLERFALADRADERLERFSGGMRRRVEIAKALIHQPRVLVLDEPSAGLDPSAQRQMWADLQRLRDQEGLTILLTTHLMSEAERCDRLAILTEGRVVALDRPAALKAIIGGEVITLEPATNLNATDGQNATDQLQDLAEQITQVLTASHAPSAAAPAQPRIVDGRIQVEHEEAVSQVPTLFNALPNRFQAVTVSRPTLEDVFVHLTGSTLEQAEQYPDPQN